MDDKIELTTSTSVKSISEVAATSAVASASEAVVPFAPPPAPAIKVATLTPAEYKPVSEPAIGSAARFASDEIPRPSFTAASAADCEVIPLSASIIC